MCDIPTVIKNVCTQPDRTDQWPYERLDIDIRGCPLKIGSVGAEEVNAAQPLLIICTY